ncbi:MAG: hypothetical protein NZ927_06410 [Candidatus Calescibacterium sp.]|nr:hypothetical protein [Candidatus Calescibacterium sp.]MCX7734090.1 hypothetical protein [bacterium]
MKLIQKSLRTPSDFEVRSFSKNIRKREFELEKNISVPLFFCILIYALNHKYHKSGRLSKNS